MKTKSVLLIIGLLLTSHLHANAKSLAKPTISEVQNRAFYCQKGEVKIDFSNKAHEKLFCVLPSTNGSYYQMSYSKGDSFAITSYPDKDGKYDSEYTVMGILDAIKLLGGNPTSEIASHFSTMPLSSNYDIPYEKDGFMFFYTSKGGFSGYGNYMVEIWPASFFK